MASGHGSKTIQEPVTSPRIGVSPDVWGCTVREGVVDRLKRQVADEAGLELRQELNSAEAVKTKPNTAEVDEVQLAETLKALRAA